MQVERTKTAPICRFATALRVLSSAASPPKIISLSDNPVEIKSGRVIWSLSNPVACKREKL
jgi:hypothetical protein